MILQHSGELHSFFKLMSCLLFCLFVCLFVYLSIYLFIYRMNILEDQLDMKHHSKMLNIYIK